MGRKAKQNVTRLEIIQLVTRVFLQKGYTNTTSSMICDELGMSKGNLTYYFPTKEDILAIVVEMLCDFQWEMMHQAVDDGNTSLMAFCLELTAMASICEESEIEKDFYLSVYTHPLTLDIIRRNDLEKVKMVFGEYCKEWNEEKFKEAETLTSGIEYATLMVTETSSPLEMRITGALDAIMQLFCVPEDIRKVKIAKVLAMDYRAIGRRILKEFIEYTEKVNEHALEDMIKSKSKRKNI